jgi:hypothetical protein
MMMMKAASASGKSVKLLPDYTTPRRQPSTATTSFKRVLVEYVSRPISTHRGAMEIPPN